MNKKILFVSGSLPPLHCGVGIYTAHLLEALLKAEKNVFEYSILTSTKNSELSFSVPIKTVDGWRLRNLRRIWKAVADTNPNIVHIQYPTDPYGRAIGICFLPLLLRLRRPRTTVTLTVHELHEANITTTVRILFMALFASTIFVSNGWDQSMLSRLGARRKTRLVPIAPNITVEPKNPALYASTLAKWQLKHEAPTIVFFGVVSRNKGAIELVRLLSLIENYQLVILGAKNETDSYHAEILKLAKQTGAQERLAWPGFVADELVSVMLHNGSYFILPQPKPVSTKSGTLLAALAHGILAISTGDNHSAGRQIPLKHLQNIYLAEQPTAKHLAEAINKLQANKTLSKNIIAGELELARQFSWPAIAENHIRYYETIKP